MSQDQPDKAVKSSKLKAALLLAGMLLFAGLCFVLFLVAGARRTEWVLDQASTGQFRFEPQGAVKHLGGPEGAAERLATYIRLPDRIARRQVVAFSLMIHCGAAAVPELVALLKHTDIEVRTHAAWALANIGPEAAPAVPALIEHLASEHWEDREGAASALGEIGPEATPAVPALMDALKDPIGQVRGRAIVALGQIGPPAAAAVPALARMVRDRSGPCAAAATALGSIGPAAKPAAPALRELMKTPGKDRHAQSIRWAAAGALVRLSPNAQEQLPVLLDALKKGDYGQRLAAVESLGLLGPAAAAAVPQINALRNAGMFGRSPKSAAVLKQALDRIQPPAKTKLPAKAGGRPARTAPR